MTKPYAFSLTVILIGVFFFTGCGNSDKKERSSLQNEVLNIHDEAMTKMDAIYNSKSKLRSIKDSLTTDSSTDHSKAIAQINVQIKNLEEANQAMLDWMHHFKKPDENMIQEEAMNYLKKEKEKITQVKVRMENTIDDAEKIIKAYKR